MDIATIRNVYKRFRPERAVLFIGDHGVGKSSFNRQLAEENNLKYVDVRLGQMTEGDLLGLYSIVNGQTENHPPSWYMDATREPCLLHFDELNRGLPSVIQGVFQIILDRTLGKYALHPGTRVCASINQGAEYDVVDLDPALFDRFATIQFEPTQEEFLVWAEKNMHPAVYDFLSRNRGHIEMAKRTAEPGKVTPSRRSWKMFSDDISNDLDARDYSFVRSVARTLVGDEAAAAFSAYLSQRKIISHDDVLNSYKTGMLEGLRESDLASLTDAVVSYILADGDFNKSRQKNFVNFCNDLPDEFVASVWRKVNQTDKSELVGGLLIKVLERVF